ncbi:MAG: FtsK/SpoIIIE domain-containing protein [Verrucomicrobiales bacterium]
MNSKELSVEETLRLLEELTGGVRSFSEREKGIERARQLRDSNLRQSIEEDKGLLEKEFAETVSHHRAEAEEKRRRVEEVFEQRRVRIDQAQIKVRNRVIAEIQETEGARRFALQRRFMEAGREREARRAALSAENEKRSGEAGSLQKRSVWLEKQTARSLRGFGSLQRRVVAALKEADEPSAEPAEPGEMDGLLRDFKERLTRFRRQPLVAFFNGFPLVLQIFVILAVGGAAPFLVSQLGGPEVAYAGSLGLATALTGLVLVLFFAARSRASRFLAENQSDLVSIKEKRLRYREAMETWLKEETAAIEADFLRIKREFEKGLEDQSSEKGAERKYSGPDEVEKRAADLKARLASAKQARLDSVDRRLKDAIAEAERRKKKRLEALSGEVSASSSEVAEDLTRQFESLIDQWRDSVVPAHRRLSEESKDNQADSHPLAPDPERWEPPEKFRETLFFGDLKYPDGEVELTMPTSERMTLESSPEYLLPLRLRIPDAASVLIETKNVGREESIDFLNYLVLGWLAGSPAGRLSFSLVDPVGLGESFAGLMHLADYEEILINTRIRTQPEQIERRLGELCDHMEKVIQMYLRNDYDSITQYNEAAGTIAERYYFLVVADFPHGFSDLAARRLLSIASSGARCGVFLLLHCDLRADLPTGFRMEDLRKACVCLRTNADDFFLKDNPVKGTSLALAGPPPPDEFAKWVHRIGEFNRDSNRIEVPFSFIAPNRGQRWTGETADELRVPVGRTGATKLQYLSLGKGTCQHALIAGKTGSGKSTLFHIIVTNLALWCDPDEVEFYLIDFKKGVEFKCYADHELPHARVIAIESDREFGLSVLQRLDEELKHRGDLFRAAGVQDVSSYRKTERSVPLPRTLLLIDEFQEFFVEDDQISQQAAVLLDRVVRQGRAFGIHAILGSQTLGGAFTLARATLGQMTVRIALACNESDAYLIMDDSNPAPRLLTRPGEGIYNDRAGAAEANSPFQVVWLSESERDTHLEDIRMMAENRGGKALGQVVFEGNAPADIAHDAAVNAVLAAPGSGTTPRLFLGAPNAIKGPTEVRFERQSGANLLMVGQRDDAVDSMIACGLRLLRTEMGDAVRLILIDNRFSRPDDESWLRRAVEKIGGVECPSMQEMGDLVNELAAEVKRHAEGEGGDPATSTVLFIPSLHRYKKLRFEEDFSFSLEEETEAKPSASLNELIGEGPGWGCHVVTSVDSYSNANRFLGRKGLEEFEKKVLFQMSAADSASLVDTGKAADLGMNRALFYDEPTGTAEIFRPYAPPSLGWFE